MVLIRYTERKKVKVFCPEKQQFQDFQDIFQDFQDFRTFQDFQDISGFQKNSGAVACLH